MVMVWLWQGPAFATQSCGGEPGWASAWLDGRVQGAEPYRYDAQSFSFGLSPAAFGWRIEMQDAAGAALPVFAAPLRPLETKPTNIAGWHFRNLANTGPNTGDVNAPQRQRRFTFGTIAQAAQNGGTTSGDEGLGGLGVLEIEEFTLTPVETGARAAMSDLRFSVCLIWRGGGEKLDPIVVADPGVAFENVIANLIGCGLDVAIYKASDRMTKGREGGQAAFLEPDLDGDNIPDLVVPITRRSDQAPGLAICLLGDETLVLAGFDGRIGRHLDPAYFGRADYWAIHRGQVFQGAEEGPPPELPGDAVLLARQEASSVLLFLDADTKVSSYWQGD